MVSFLLVWCIGLCLGGMFFGGLWWTVQKSVASANPALYFFTSLLIRMGLALGGFYFVLTTPLGEPAWQLLLLCLLGFLTARLLITRWTRVKSDTVIQIKKES